MKRMKHYIAAMAALFSVATLHADEATAAPAPAETAPAVTAYLNSAAFLTGQPMADAQYYIYIYSASWCGPCKALMPEIVKEYKKMKKKKHRKKKKQGLKIKKKIINMGFYKNKTQVEIAEEIGISQAQVSRLEKNAINHMKKYL